MKATKKDDIQKLLAQNRKNIEFKFHVKEIGLFGSFVTGANTSGSDIDILVAFHKGHKDFFNYMRLKNYLQELFKGEVDLVMKEAVKPRLKEGILAQVQYV
jgi:uncharacterized protein